MPLAADARLRALMDTMIDPLAIYTAVRDVDGRIVDFTFVDVNPAACAYNGLSREQLIGAGTRALMLPYANARRWYRNDEQKPAVPASTPPLSHSSAAVRR